ncbi:MAG: hypothetical protein J6S42_05110 [Thermoguttaceae bacterium]|nr:hypothetical protein [Thermoguttaceae bacterium]
MERIDPADLFYVKSDFTGTVQKNKERTGAGKIGITRRKTDQIIIRFRWTNRNRSTTGIEKEIVTNAAENQQSPNETENPECPGDFPTLSPPGISILFVGRHHNEALSPPLIEPIAPQTP